MPGGRPRKPTNLKILEGNRGRRDLDPSAEPQPTPGIPRMPAGMPSIAQSLWRVLSVELDSLNLLTLVDATALEAACRAVAQGRMADRAIEKLQQSIARGKSTKDDIYRLSIMNSVSKKAWQQYKSFCTEFGLTPAARSRLSGEAEAITPKSKADYIERSLCG